MIFKKAKQVFKKSQILNILFLFLQFNLMSQSSNCEIGIKLVDKEYSFNGENFYHKTFYEPIKICKGSLIKLVAKEEANTTYQLFYNDLELKDSTGLSISIKEPGIYMVKAYFKNLNCNGTSSKIVIENYEKLPIGILEFVGVQNEIGTNLFCGNIGRLTSYFQLATFQEIEYLLFKNGEFQSKSKNHNQIITKSGEYQVIAKVGSCQSVSNKVKVEKDSLFNVFGNAFYHKYLEKKPNKINTINIFQCETDLRLLPYSYNDINWYKNNEKLTHKDVYFSNAMEGKYAVDYTDFQGCKIKDSVLIKKAESKQKLLLNLDNRGCEYFFYIENRGRENNYLVNVKVEWFKNNTPYTTTTSPILFISRTEKAKYKAIIELNDCQTYESEEFEFIPEKYKYSKFEIFVVGNKDKKKISICSNNIINLRCNNFANYRINLFKDGKFFKSNPPIDSTDNYTNDFEIAETGNYYAKINSLSNCEAFSDTISVNVVDNVPKLISQSFENCKTSLTVTKKDAEKYQWIKDGKKLENSLNFEIIPKESGKYSIVSADGECLFESNIINFNRDDQLKLEIPPTAKISGGGQIFASDSASLKVDFTSSAPWIFALNNSNNEITTDKNPYIFKVKNTADYAYELKSVKNGCGLGTVSGKALVTVVLAGEEITDTEISVYPNPASDLINISVKSPQNSKIELKLLNLDGKILKSNSSERLLNNHNISIGILDFPPSIYFLKVIINKKENTYKIVKK